MLKYLFIFFIISSSLLAKEKLTFSCVQSIPTEKFILISDFIKKGFRHAGYDLEVIQLPDERALISADLGKYDGDLIRVRGDINYSNNLIKIEFPILYVNLCAYSMDKDLIINSWNDLNSYNVVYIRGNKLFEQNLYKIRHKNIKSAVKTLDVAMKLLKKKRVDLLLTVQFLFEEYLKNNKNTNISMFKDPIIIEKLPTYILIHKKHRDKISKLEKSFKHLMENGEYEKFINDIYKN